MKSYGGNGVMWNKFVTYNNWNTAQKKSRIGKAKRKAVRKFEGDSELFRVNNVIQTQQRALDPDWYPGEYKVRKVYEPKERIIYIAPYEDRIVQHAALNVMLPYFMNMFVTNSYACVPGRGQLHASIQTMKMVKRYPYCYEMDVQKCFPSVSQQLLSDMLHENFVTRAL